jgi:hypothetical protein
VKDVAFRLVRQEWVLEMFGRRRKADLNLLGKLLEVEAQRAVRASELEVRKLEIEMAHLEGRNKATIELESARQELRQKRAEWARKARERAAARGIRGGYPIPAEQGDCKVCRGITMGLSPEDIFTHREHMGWAQPQGS